VQKNEHEYSNNYPKEQIKVNPSIQFYNESNVSNIALVIKT